MKKYFKRNNTTVESMRQRALEIWKNKTLDTRNEDHHIINCYLDSFLDEMVKQGLLKFELNKENKVDYFNEELNGFERNKNGHNEGSSN